MHYYEVAPLTYIGDETNLLTYESEAEIKNGTAVKIPLRNKSVLGVIICSVKKPEFETKKIIEQVFDKPVLNENLLKLSFWISDYYGSPLVSILQTMIPAGITKSRRKVREDITEETAENPLKLTTTQSEVIKNIQNSPTKTHLVFGVTGSGKTEIYLQLISETLTTGKQAIVLVPEVSLTPQTLKRFKRRFGNKVCLLHSYLKETERFNTWKEILEGKKQVVVGSRSALFAPFDNLGLIVIDEEHENSYKQNQTPKYHAVTVAEKLSKFSGAGLVLGSATPSLTTFFKAKNGEYILHTLSNRIVQDELPPVEIIDMRNEFKYGNKSIFSEKLQKEMRDALTRKKQIMLFLNRRGMSTFVSCRDCGYVEKCSNCDVPLTYHLNTGKLECHHCGLSKQPPTFCPECRSLAIRFFGSGTERVEQEVKKIFSDKYTVSRMDRDTTKKTGSHGEIFESFADRKVDILIGTQMISKGFDLENVGMVGVISADTILNFPDYTANEQTFDLLTQVAGRTGRGQDQGKVIIQTYTPDNFAIRMAAKHDYEGFYKEEIKNRQELNYPPFATLIKMLYNNFDQNKAKSEAEEFINKVNEILSQNNIKYILLGPSPAFIPKKANNYYYQISIKILENTEEHIIQTVKLLNKITKNGWSIDVDPGDLL